MSGGLAVTGLVVSPGGSQAPVLRGIDLEVSEGEIVAVVGPSGAGKTTLLRALAGLEKPEAGEIALGGVSQLRLPAHRRRIAMVFQEPRLLPHLSVEDNVGLPLRVGGVAKEARRQAARARLGEVGLGGFAERRVAGLSGGEQQRVSLARALCADPDLLLLDEPLAALDPNRRESLRVLLASVLTARRLTTLLVTHDRTEAAEMGDSIALMLEGSIVQHDEPSAMFERPASGVAARFFGISNLLRIPGGPPGQVWAIQPEHVAVGAGELTATVVESTYRGSRVRLVLDWQGQRVEAMVDPAEAPAAGALVGFTLPAERLWPLPGDASTGSRTPAEDAGQR